MQMKHKLSNYYYLLIIISYALTLFFSFVRPGVLGALLMVLIFAETLFLFVKSESFDDIKKLSVAENIKKICLADAVLCIYFVYNIASVIWLTHYGYPVSVYSTELVSSILPIVFYFVARCKNNDRQSFYKWFLFAILFLGIISILLYVIAPQFYCDYLFNWSYISKADQQTVRVRMESITGSTALSYLGVAAMGASAYFIFPERNKPVQDKKTGEKGKKLSLSNTQIFAIFMFFFSILLVFMANGRAGMVAAILVILFLNYLIIFKLKILDKKFFYGEVIAVVLFVVAMVVVTPSVANKIWARLVSLPGAVGQRSEQWIAAANNMKGAWLGNGLGANGHRAIGIEGAHVVADGGLVKLFCEEGSVGFGLFSYIMLYVLIKGYKKINSTFAEIAIIATSLLMSIGSNIIAFQLCTPIFWYGVGSIVKITEEEKQSLD